MIHRQANSFLDDVLQGLARPRKQLPAKYFYDATGSQLFDQITELEEYYLTRTEIGILKRSAPTLAECCGPNALLIEPGAGSLRKVRFLLDRLNHPAGYIPVDVSGGHLLEAAGILRRKYPSLAVAPLQADFSRGFEVPAIAASRRILFFPGSTIGNFEPPEAAALLRSFRQIAGPGGGLILGVDLRKDPCVLELAYNDRRGVTAAFNLNLLARINRELGGDFQLEAFQHRAFFNAEHSRVEMHLVSLRNQQVHLAGEAFRFREGESLHTENSHKYDVSEFRFQLAELGWRTENLWTDDRCYFAVLFCTAV